MRFSISDDCDVLEVGVSSQLPRKSAPQRKRQITQRLDIVQSFSGRLPQAIDLSLLGLTGQGLRWLDLPGWSPPECQCISQIICYDVGKVEKHPNRTGMSVMSLLLVGWVPVYGLILKIKVEESGQVMFCQHFSRRSSGLFIHVFVYSDFTYVLHRMPHSACLG